MNNFQTWKPSGYYYKCYDWNQGRYHVVMGGEFIGMYWSCNAITDDFGNLVKVE